MHAIFIAIAMLKFIKPSIILYLFHQVYSETPQIRTPLEHVHNKRWPVLRGRDFVWDCSVALIVRIRVGLCIIGASTRKNSTAFLFD